MTRSTFGRFHEECRSVSGVSARLAVFIGNILLSLPVEATRDAVLGKRYRRLRERLRAGPLHHHARPLQAQTTHRSRPQRPAYATNGTSIGLDSASPPKTSSASTLSGETAGSFFLTTAADPRWPRSSRSSGISLIRSYTVVFYSPVDLGCRSDVSGRTHVRVGAGRRSLPGRGVHFRCTSTFP